MYKRQGKKITGIEKIFNTKVHENNIWGLEWFDGTVNAFGKFPTYFRHEGDRLIAISEDEVPAETNLITRCV